MPIDFDALVPGGALQGPLFARLARERVGLGEAAAGERFGPFRIVREIGRGGMAVVYLGERADGEFEQQVALKLVASGDGRARAEAQFRQERRILARLAHPNIARLVDGGQREDGALWFAMEHVEGERIDRWCERRVPDLRARVALLVQVCSAVAFAHARLAVHRDIKPSNILVTADGTAKLLDFGIAALLGDEASSAAATPAALTPGFASPEQLRGEPATTSSDVWQLGRLLVELCAARDRDLAAIQARACAAEPAQRYGTVAAFSDDLQNWIARRPVAARKGGTGYRIARFVGRHRLLVGGALLAATLFVATVVAFTLGLAAERDRAQQQAERAQQVSRLLLDVFKAADPNVHRGRMLRADELLQLGAERLQGELADQPELLAEMLQQVARALRSIDQGESARDLLRRSIALSDSLPQVQVATRAERRLDLAGVLNGLGAYEDSLPVIDEARLLLGDLDANSRLAIRMDATRASALAGAGRLEEAIVLASDVVQRVERTLADDAPLSTYSWRQLSTYQHRNGDYARAVESAERGWRRALSAYGEMHRETVQSEANLGVFLGYVGRFDAADSHLNHALDTWTKMAGPDDGTTGYVLNALGQLRTFQGRPSDALPLIDRADAIYDKALAPNHPTRAMTWQHRGDAEVALGDDAAAIVAYRRALELRLAALPAGHADIGRSRKDLGLALQRTGATDEGCTELGASIEVLARRLPEGHPFLREARAGVARCPAAAAAGTAGD